MAEVGVDGPNERFTALFEEHAQALREGREDDADAATRKMMAHAMQQAENRHSPQSDLLQRASDCEERADWDGAERAYGEAIAVAERPAMKYYARERLAGHHALRGHKTAALEEARRARDAAMREDIPTVHWLGLYDHANAALDAGALAEARAAADGAMSLAEEINADDISAPLMLLRVRTLRARVSIAEGKWDDARRELEAVPAPRPDKPRADMPGICAAEARWWEADALLLLHDGDTGAAVEARQYATQRRRWVIEAPQTDAPRTRQALARSLEALAEAQHAAGRDAEAGASGAESRAIHASLRLPAA